MTEEVSPPPIPDWIKETKEKWDSWADVFVEVHIVTQLSKVEKNMSAAAKAEFMERLNSLDHGLMHGGEKYVFTADRFDEIVEIMEAPGTIYPNEKQRSSFRASGPAGGVEDGTLKALNQRVLKQVREIRENPQYVFQAVYTAESRQQVFNSVFQADIASKGWDGGAAYITPGTFATYISAIALVGQFGTNGQIGAQEFPGPKYMTMANLDRNWPQYIPFETIEYDRDGSYKFWNWVSTARVDVANSTNSFAPGTTSTMPEGFLDFPQSESLEDIKAGYTTSPAFTKLDADRTFGYLTGSPVTYSNMYRDSAAKYFRIGDISNAPPRGIPASWNSGWSIHTNEFINRIARNYPKKVEQAFLPLLQKLMQNDPDVEIDPNNEEPDGSEYEEGPAPPPSYIQSPSDLAPVDLQCFLFENIRLLTDRAQEARDPNQGGEAFQHFSMLNGGRGTPGNLISYLQAGEDAAGGAFLNICPDVYALLTPFMKFYRVDYKDDDKLKPYKETRIPFPNFINPSDIENITNFKWGRFRGAGIKSFSWKLDGVQPAEVENNISANLNIYFQTLQDMFSLNWNGGRAQAGIPNQAGYLDLIIWLRHLFPRRRRAN